MRKILIIAAGIALVVVAVVAAVVVFTLPRTVHYDYRGTDPDTAQQLRENFSWTFKSHNGDGPISGEYWVETNADNGTWVEEPREKFYGHQHGKTITVDGSYFDLGTQKLIGTISRDGNLRFTDVGGNEVTLGIDAPLLVPLPLNAG